MNNESKQIFLILSLLLCGCSIFTESPLILDNLLISEGCTNISYHGYSWFGCSDKDAYATKFSCTRNYIKVNGVVCGGVYFKAHTIRYFDGKD